MADENKNTENLNAAATSSPAPGSEADMQEWERAKNAGLRGIDAYLQRRGFDPKEETKWGRNMLHWAASHGFLEVVKHLIEKCKFGPKKPNYRGATAVLAAAEGGSLPIVQYLVQKYGADILKAKQEGDHQDDNAGDVAARNGHLSVVKYLCEAHGFQPGSILLTAAEHGHLSIVQYLVEKYGHDVLHATAFGWRGYTPMHLAARDGHLHLVRYLSLFAFNFRNRADGYTALGWAINEGHTEIVRFLIEEMGCDPAKEHRLIQVVLEFAEEKRSRGRPVDETHVTFCRQENLHNLYQQYVQRQIFLTAIAADIVVDEKIGGEKVSFPDELLSVIAEYAAPAYPTISEAGAAKSGAAEEGKLAPHEEIKAVLSTYSNLVEYVQKKIAHLPVSISSSLLALLHTPTLQDRINAAKFLGKVILNAPPLTSVDQLQNVILPPYLKEREQLDTAFVKALRAIAAHLEKSRQTAVLAKVIFDRILRREEEATAPCERTGRTRAERAANGADNIDRKYDDLYKLVQRDPGILQFPVSADSTLGEYIAPHLESILKRAREEMLLKKAVNPRIEKEYQDNVRFFIHASGLPKREKDVLYRHAHAYKYAPGSTLGEKMMVRIGNLFLPPRQNRPVENSVSPSTRQAILVANLFAEAQRQQTPWKYLHAYRVIKANPAILEQPVSEGKTLGQAIAPHLGAFLTILDQHTLHALEVEQKTQQIQHTYFRQVTQLIEASGLDQEEKNALYVWCAHSRTVNHTPPPTGFFRAAPADANQFWRDMFLAQRKEVEEKNELYCAGS